MKTEIRISKSFSKEAKSFFKRYPSFSNDLSELREQLLKNPYSGVQLGNNTFKIRVRIKSKGKGKSGGARVISYVTSEVVNFIEVKDDLIIVTLITIYDKSEMDSLSNQELKELIRQNIP